MCFFVAAEWAKVSPVFKFLLPSSLFFGVCGFLYMICLMLFMQPIMIEGYSWWLDERNKGRRKVTFHAYFNSPLPVALLISARSHREYTPYLLASSLLALASDYSSRAVKWKVMLSHLSPFTAPPIKCKKMEHIVHGNPGTRVPGYPCLPYPPPLKRWKGSK